VCDTDRRAQGGRAVRRRNRRGAHGWWSSGARASGRIAIGCRRGGNPV